MDAIALLVLYGKGQRDFIDIDINGVNFTGAILSGIDLQCSRLIDANLPDTDLRGADLQYTFLVNANLEGANLQGANLKRANLQGANLKNANLKRANLTYANLEDANLQGANLQNATCRGANLKVVNHAGVTWPSKKNLVDAILPNKSTITKKTTAAKSKAPKIIIPDIELEIPEILPNNRVELEFNQKVTQIQNGSDAKINFVLEKIEKISNSNRFT
jgi:Pentapeptide repeats (8 copies)